jgi:hypothetical protein
MYFATILMQNSVDSEAVQKAMVAFFAIMPIIILVGLAIVIVPSWFILKKAGFSPWLSLLNAVPLGNLFLLYFLAFAQWKVVPAVPFVQLPVQPPYPPNYPPQA